MTEAVSFDTRDEWLAWRLAAPRLGGSQLGAAIGVDPYDPDGTRLWRQIKGLDAPRQTGPMEAGNYFERAILEWHADRERVPLLVADRPTVFWDAEHYQSGTIDAAQLVDRDSFGVLVAPLLGLRDSWEGVVDAKFVNERRGRNAYGPAGSTKLPETHFVQGQSYCRLTGLPWCDFAVQVSNEGPPRAFRVHHEPDTSQALAEACRDWVTKHLIGDVPPERADADARAIAESARDAVQPLDATADDVEIVRRLVLIRRARETLDGIEALLRSHLERAMTSAGATSIGIPRATLRGEHAPICEIRSRKGRRSTSHVSVADELEAKLAKLLGAREAATLRREAEDQHTTHGKPTTYLHVTPGSDLAKLATLLQKARGKVNGPVHDMTPVLTGDIEERALLPGLLPATRSQEDAS